MWSVSAECESKLAEQPIHRQCSFSVALQYAPLLLLLLLRFFLFHNEDDEAVSWELAT